MKMPELGLHGRPGNLREWIYLQLPLASLEVFQTKKYLFYLRRESWNAGRIW